MKHTRNLSKWAFNLQSNKQEQFYTFFNDCPHLKNVCFASMSNLLMNCCKAFSPDSLWWSSVQTNISESAISKNTEQVEVILTKCCIGHSVRTRRRFCEFQHKTKPEKESQDSLYHFLFCFFLKIALDLIVLFHFLLFWVMCCLPDLWQTKEAPQIQQTCWQTVVLHVVQALCKQGLDENAHL